MMEKGAGTTMSSIHEALVASSRDALYAISSAGTVLSWNGGARVLLGVPADEAVGASLEGLFRRNGFAPDTAKRIKDAIAQARQVGAARVVTSSNKSDGTTMQMEVSLESVKAANGDVDF